MQKSSLKCAKIAITGVATAQELNKARTDLMVTGNFRPLEAKIRLRPS
jgi:hypothetical protein